MQIRLMLIGGLAALLLGGAAGAEQDSEPVAVVNGRPISQAMFDAYVDYFDGQLGDVSRPEVRRQVIDEVVTWELLVQDAERRKLRQEPDIALELELARRKALADSLIRKLLEENAPDEAAIRAEYEQVAPLIVGKEYKIRHIVVATAEEAYSLIRQLREGADFTALAKAHSLVTGNEPGLMGWFTTVGLAGRFGEDLFQHVIDSGATVPLKVGELRLQPVKSDQGWHVIQLADIRDAPPPPLEDLRGQMQDIIARRTYNEYLDRLRDQADIQIR
ncbi:MAG: peptidyl-prolyl cis-trans isomerase [Pseudomonadota bacterium]|nr:peptidyl-prolyl cis-trans isomerase [Pseudomonadota bacterium]